MIDQQSQDPAGEGERQGRQEAVFCFKQKTQPCFLYKIKEGNQKGMPTFELWNLLYYIAHINTMLYSSRLKISSKERLIPMTTNRRQTLKYHTASQKKKKKRWCNIQTCTSLSPTKSDVAHLNTQSEKPKANWIAFMKSNIQKQLPDSSPSTKAYLGGQTTLGR